MSLRFVILHHRVTGGEHWDLCLEQGESLLTWQLEREPVDRATLPIPARRIGDHRKDYLDYQGPVSGGRGEVARTDEGEVIFEQAADGRYVVRLTSRRLTGRFSLTAEGEAWAFEAVDDPQHR